MGQVMHLGGRRVLSYEEMEQRRLGLVDTLGRARAALVEAGEQVGALTAQVHRLEGGIIEADWALEQMTVEAPKVEEET